MKKMGNSNVFKIAKRIDYREWLMYMAYVSLGIWTLLRAWRMI